MEPASHLCVILDLSPTQWHLSSLSKNTYPLSFRTFLAQTLVFLNSHIACKHENTLAVFGALPGRSVLLYSSTEGVSDADSIVADANAYLPFQTIDTAVTEKIMDELEALGEPEDEAPCQLVGALTKSLCYINRIMDTSTAGPLSDASPLPKEPRVLILSVSPDISSSYVPLMNTIFSAQKLKVTIDVCKIYGADAVFLQQAAHLTGGSYVSLERRDALLQHLIMTFLPVPSMRRIMAVPTQDKIDFRAACFCHKRVIDIGYICSVCLSIFCQPVPVCSTCRTKFPIKTLQRLNAARPSLPSANQTNNRAPPSRLSAVPASEANQPSNGPRPGMLPSSNSIRVNGGGISTPGRGTPTSTPRRDHATPSRNASSNGHAR